jgi:HlyD family secretion protein
MKKVIPIVVVLVLAAVVVALYLTTGERPLTEIVLSGNIEATTVNVSFQTSGRITELRSDEGQVVRQGQLLAALDATELNDREAGATARLASTGSQIPQLETSIRLQRESTRTDVARAEAALAAAQAQLEEMRNGARPQELEQARQAQAAVKSRMENTSLELARARELYQTGAVPKKVLDSAQSAYDMAEADFRKSSESLALVVEGPRQENIAAAQARVRQAQAQLEQARLGELAARKLEQQLETLHSEVEFARTQQRLAETQKGYATLVSPVNGHVLSRNMEVGEMAAVGAPVFSIADLTDIWLRVFLPAPDLGKVKLGQAVTVTTDSYPNKKYQGTISFISSEAEFTPKTIQTQKERVKLVYRLKIQIKNENQELKPGMPADASIPL